MPPAPGSRAADRGPDGAPLPPSVVRARCAGGAGDAGRGHPRHRIGDAGRVHTAAAVAAVVDEVVAEADRVVLFPPGARRGAPEPGDVWQEAARCAGQAPDPRRRRKLGHRDGGPGPVRARRRRVHERAARRAVRRSAALRASWSAAAREAVRPRPQSGDGSGAAVTDAAVKAVGADVYDDAGDRDNAGRVSRVIDGNPDTGWKTFNYKQQFPALKPGVGIMTSFASPVQLSSLVIESPSPAPRSRSAPRRRRTPSSATPCCSPAPHWTTATRRWR